MHLISRWSLLEKTGSAITATAFTAGLRPWRPFRCTAIADADGRLMISLTTIKGACAVRPFVVVVLCRRFDCCRRQPTTNYRRTGNAPNGTYCKAPPLLPAALFQAPKATGPSTIWLSSRRATSNCESACAIRCCLKAAVSPKEAACG